MKIQQSLFLFCVLFFGVLSPVQSYQPDWKDVVDQFQDKIKWERASYEVEVQVFDPFRFKPGYRGDLAYGPRLVMFEDSSDFIEHV